MRSYFLLLVGVTLLAGPVLAQRVQNSDISFLYGPAVAGSSRIPGSDVTLQSAVGLTSATCYGYQIARPRVGSLWIEASPVFVITGRANASIGGRARTQFSSYTLGLRLMVPVHTRLSVFGALGGGAGTFNYPVIEEGAKPFVTSNSTTHGVLQLGAGIDFRLTQGLSLRGELRDFVSGSGLSGSDGPHHLVPLFGMAFHF
jgi:opacity protein-like surface antigen